MKDRWLTFFLFGYLCVLLKDNIFFIGLLVCLIWIYKYRDYTFLILIIFICFLELNSYTRTNGTMIGRVIDAKENYVIIKNGDAKTIVYNCDNCIFDSLIQVEGTLKTVPDTLSNYGFNFAKWASQKGTSTSIYAKDTYQIKDTKSGRGLIQQKINTINNEEIKIFLNKIIFNINDADDYYYSMVTSIGFTYIGFLSILRRILKYFFTTKTVNIVECIIILLLCFFYHWSFLTSRILFTFLLRFSKHSKADNAGFLGILCCILFHNYLLTMSFIIPFTFRLISLVHFRYKKMMNIFVIAFIQGIFLSQINVVLLVAYRTIMKIFGFFYLLAFLQIWFPTIRIDLCFNRILQMIEPIFDLTIYGNPIGLGIFIYLFMCLIAKSELYTIILYFCFMLFGWFHPFAEATFINVNQGDAILLRLSFNTHNILIDTGKESSYKQLKAMLNAKSIHTIDELYISHSDLDHSGNIDNLERDFNILQIIEGHSLMNDEKSMIQDINTFSSENTNDSSQVLYITINDLKFLMTGDISKQIESDLVKRYSSLEIDVLKISHHGSNTSTSDIWLNKTNPKLAVISSGVDNQYGHPHKETMNALEKKEITSLNTQTEGDITIYFTRNFNFIHTSSRKIGIITKVMK